MSKNYENQIQFVCKTTNANVSYHINFAAQHGRWPNSFWITNEGRLAMVFIELNPKYTGNKCYAQICDGINGAIFDPKETSISFKDITVEYQENKIVHFDESTQQFVFNDLGTTNMVNCTTIFRKRIIVGIKNSKNENAPILASVESPAYVPFTANGLLIPNAFYFGQWGNGNLGIYQFYYLFDAKNNVCNMKIVPFISREECKKLKLNMKTCVMVIQVKYKGKNNKEKTFKRWFYEGTEAFVEFHLEGEQQFSFGERSPKYNDFKNDADYVVQCKNDGIKFLSKKL